eukprot:TRINITY_DN642_c0_g1_i2.p1 TRINITY_DN642_c0_g1~~TRINITY_DN642_c0_g1_i2.p1  ORF type:complete len:187 (+),score=27.77 TRINITY_DN642_c0_g1_i2:59-619(+)
MEEIPVAHSFIKRVIVSEQQIQEKVKELATRISSDYREIGSLTVIGILHGAFIFMADLVREISDLNVHVDFMSVSSYGDESKSSGAVKIIMDTKKPILGKHILVVEDIIDSGLTLKYLLGVLEKREPASLECCVLLQKAGSQYTVNPKYVGWECPKEAFVVGYGLDFANKHRCLKYVGELKDSEWK